MYITIYVDDIIIACDNLAYMLEVKMMFGKNFDMTDMGALEHFLNVRVTRTRRFIQQTGPCIHRRCWTSSQTSDLLRRPGRVLSTS